MTNNDVLAERTRIEGLVASRTLIDMLAATARDKADDPAYSDRHHVLEGESWRTITWAQTRERALDVAVAFMARGVAPDDTVAIMASNRTEHYLADMGAVHADATPMSIYNTLSTDQVAFIASESRPTAVVLETADHLARWTKAIDEVDSITTVVVLDAAIAPEGEKYVTWDDLIALGADKREELASELEERIAHVTSDTPATILYTSGTTGNPKGVVLTHHNVVYETLSTLEAAGLQDPQVAVSYLPLAHIAERVLGLYGPQIQGCLLYTSPSPRDS